MTLSSRLWTAKPRRLLNSPEVKQAKALEEAEEEEEAEEAEEAEAEEEEEAEEAEEAEAEAEEAEAEAEAAAAEARREELASSGSLRLSLACVLLHDVIDGRRIDASRSEARSVLRALHSGGSARIWIRASIMAQFSWA